MTISKYGIMYKKILAKGDFMKINIKLSNRLACLCFSAKTKTPQLKIFKFGKKIKKSPNLERLSNIPYVALTFYPLGL